MLKLWWQAVKLTLSIRQSLKHYWTLHVNYVRFYVLMQWCFFDVLLSRPPRIASETAICFAAVPSFVRFFWLRSAVITTHVLSMLRSLMLRTLYFSSSSVLSHAFSVLCVYSKFEHHPHLHPPGYLCAKFSFFRGLHCWGSSWRKIAYSITHSLIQLI